jgi:hypothetical protein
MTPLRRIAACLVIAAQAILALAVPAGAAHGAPGERSQEIRDARDPHACRGPDGTWVLGLAMLGHHHHHGHDHEGHGHEGHGHEGHEHEPDECCPDRGLTGAVCFDCADGHTHLHVANVDEVRDGSRRWCLPPLTACGEVIFTVERGEEAVRPAGLERPERASRPPPSSRRALGSIVLRV